MFGSKVTDTVLKRSVVNLIQRGPRTGTDAAVFQTEGCNILSSVAVGLDSEAVSVMAAVYKAANNIWAAGGKLLGIEASFLLRQGYEETELKTLTRLVMKACDNCGTFLAGGHTQECMGLDHSCVTITAIGQRSGAVLSIRDVQAGMDIVMSKWIGLEETALLLDNHDRINKLNERFSQEYIAPAMNFAGFLTVEAEAAVAVRHGVKAMHDVSDGGIFRALWELSEGSHKGFEIELKAIPVRQETIEISDYFNLNPYKMKSAGSLLMITDNSSELMKALQQEGIAACVIGHLTGNNDKIIRNEDEIRYLDKN